MDDNTRNLSPEIEALIVSGVEAWQAQDYERARPIFEDALQLSRSSGSATGEFAALHFLGNVAFNECRDSESRQLHCEALAVCEQIGDDQGIATSLGNIALVDVVEGDFASARLRYEEAIMRYERGGCPAPPIRYDEA